MSEHTEKPFPPSTPNADSNAASVHSSPAIDSKTGAAGLPENLATANVSAGSKPQPSNAAAADPFDPMNLGISTDYAAAINVKPSAKPFELRKPNDQEFVRSSPRKDHHLVVGSIADKQDVGKIYIVASALLEPIRAEFARAVRGVELVLAQSLAGASLVWPVPLAEDRGGKWNSTQRAACEQSKARWTNMASEKGQYEVTTVNNPREVDWDSFPSFRDVLRQAAAERLIDSMDHPLLRKLRGEIE
jgi:hypothetical protein